MVRHYDYVVGQRVRFAITFTDLADEPGDPTVVRFLYRKPTGETVEVTEFTGRVPGSGIYAHEVGLDRGGWWHWRWEGTGVNETAKQGSILVEEANAVAA